MNRFLLGALTGAILSPAAIFAGYLIRHPAGLQTTLEYSSRSFAVQHIAVPAGLNDFQCAVDIPERDETDAMTVTCTRP